MGPTPVRPRVNWTYAWSRLTSNHSDNLYIVHTCIIIVDICITWIVCLIRKKQMPHTYFNNVIGNIVMVDQYNNDV